MFQVGGRGIGGVRDGKVGGKKGEDGDGETEVVEYGLKPMNCPGHCVMFKMTSGGRGLKEMPVRYADFSPLHRNEISGALTGLTRVRRFHQDDGHIFCRPNQILPEIKSTLNFILEVYKLFKLPTPQLVLSTRPDSYLGTIEQWSRAESALTEALNQSGQPWTLNEGDGAFYGPKIDIILTDSVGKRHQTATVQLDFQLPERFDLTYKSPAPAFEARGETTTDPEELKKSGMVRPVIIHRAVFGSLERFLALLMEHYNGTWPFWLNPKQAIVIPVAETPELLSYARKVRDVLAGVRTSLDDGAEGMLPLSRRTFGVEVDESTATLGRKIRNAKKEGWAHVVVVGERDRENGTVSVDLKGAKGMFGEDLVGGMEVEGWEEGKKDAVWKVEEAWRWFCRLEDEYR